MHLLIKTFLLICTVETVVSKEIYGPDVGSQPMKPIEESVFDRYKTQVCSVVPTFGGKNAKLAPLLDEMTEDEIFELAFLNMAYGLNSDSISYLNQELGYKKRIIDLIAFITKQTCTNGIVDEHFINAAKNLYLYYLYKRTKAPLPSVKPPGNGTMSGEAKLQWEEILNMLEQCSANIDSLDISEKCDDASAVLIDGEYMPIAKVTEQIDVETESSNHPMDEVIDAVWHFFSITYARCYPLYYPKEDWIIQMFDNFRQEFLHPFAARWKKPGPYAEFFPLIFGPVDFHQSRNNLRACKNAAYMVETLFERQLVRPLTVTMDSITMYNFKV